MKLLHLTMAVAFTVLIAACHPLKQSPITEEGRAPKSPLSNKYLMTVETGSGPFAEQGSWTVEFSEGFTYQVIGDGQFTTHSSGTYEYTPNGNNAAIFFEDTEIGPGLFALTFDSETSGHFRSTVKAAPDHSQAGSFSQL